MTTKSTTNTITTPVGTSTATKIFGAVFDSLLSLSIGPYELKKPGLEILVTGVTSTSTVEVLF